MAVADQGQAAVLQESAIHIHLSAEPTTSYAAHQNSVPLVREVVIENTSGRVLVDVTLRFVAEPTYSEGLTLRFDMLQPGEQRRISPVDVRLSHGFLAGLDEAVRGSLLLEASSGGEVLARVDHPIELLAYDQWAGTRALPELLAAFSMPNNPAVDRLLHAAAELLQGDGQGQTMDGYQSKHREAVWAQISAVYSAIGASNIHYAEPPASFGVDGQRIRTPDRILSGGMATCLDLAMLAASCLEQAGLNAVVLIKKGHAWVGAWLINTSFPTPLLDDVQAVRKRIKAGELLAFEAMGLGQRPLSSLRWACERGLAHLDDEAEFLYAVDIKRARLHRILPLPSREGVTAASTGGIAVGSAIPVIEAAPELPPLDGEAVLMDEEVAPDTPQGRLDRWKSKLLDLTLRNRLLNFKPTKTTLRLRVLDPHRLEDALADGAELKFRPLPRVMEGVDPRSAVVYAGRTGTEALDVLARQALDQGEILADVAEGDLEKRLSEMFSAARTNLEEGGANTLYLAFGFLRWTESERAERSQLAPLLLIPVTMQRQSVRAGYRLKRHDDDAIVNPTLLQLLRQPPFGLHVQGIEPLPTDEHGLDVARIFQMFRLAVKEVARWEVVEEVCLGIFSFTKYLMWKDLQDRAEELRRNPIVAHLIDHPQEAYAGSSGDLRDCADLDRRCLPGSLFTPLLADSSQLNAVARAGEGRDFIIEGPPGTGKSQTITNLIAHFLASGKTVLFVSEKMAALEVVQRRLDDMGLAPFCLELHSAKARKIEVLHQLKAALDAAHTHSVEEWKFESEHLARLRLELNALAAALHRVHPNGLTIYQATGTAITGRDWLAADMPWADPDTHDRQAYEALKETGRRITALGSVIDQLQDHALAALGQSEWSYQWEEQLLKTAVQVDALAGHLDAAGATLSEALGLPAHGQSQEACAALDMLCDLLLRARVVPAGLAAKAFDTRARAKMKSFRHHGESRRVLWEKLEGGYRPEVVGLDGVLLQNQWETAASSWLLKRWLGQRSVARRVAPFTRDGKRPKNERVAALLDILPRLNQEDRALADVQVDAEALLQESYRGIATNWAALASHEKWAVSFAEVASRVADAHGVEEEPLRSRLCRLVSEQRAQLAPAGKTGIGLLAFREAFRQLTAGLQALVPLAKAGDTLAGTPHEPGWIARIRSLIMQWRGAQRELRHWCAWRATHDEALAAGLQGIIGAIEDGSVPLADAERYLIYSYQSWWLKRSIDRDPVLRDFSSAEHARKIREFREADARFDELTRQYIRSVLSARVPQTTQGGRPDAELGLVLHELAKQRAHIPLRKLVQRLPTLLPRLKPCLLMSPLSVAQYLDAEQPPFDLVVFDEASQIPVWDAVGAIARGRQLVMVGDPKQLPPTSFFSKGDDDEEAAGAEQTPINDLESILDECIGAGLPKLGLDWHYRSRHESLIAFSNYRYYDGRLITFPSPVTEDHAVRLQVVGGVYDRGASRTNRAEAEAIVTHIKAHFADPVQRGLSVGVVTFNQPQQRLIEALLDEAYRVDPELERVVQAQHESLFVKNLENVQGDERDIILFSITYGPDAAGKLTMNFGPLNLDGGERRLNVAITRARAGIVMFASFLPEQIDLGRVRAGGVQDLKHYLEFAQRGARAILEQAVPTGREPDSPFEREVIKGLRDHGFEVHPQVGCSGYRIDIGVVDPRASGRYLLGIECDGRSYHSMPVARDRDRLRQQILEGLGWTVHRIWSTDWWSDPEREMRRLQEVLAHAEAADR